MWEGSKPAAASNTAEVTRKVGTQWGKRKGRLCGKQEQCPLWRAERGHPESTDYLALLKKEPEMRSWVRVSSKSWNQVSL